MILVHPIPFTYQHRIASLKYYGRLLSLRQRFANNEEKKNWERHYISIFIIYILVVECFSLWSARNAIIKNCTFYKTVRKNWKCFFVPTIFLCSCRDNLYLNDTKLDCIRCGFLDLSVQMSGYVCVCVGECCKFIWHFFLYFSFLMLFWRTTLLEEKTSNENRIYDSEIKMRFYWYKYNSENVLKPQFFSICSQVK